MEVQTEFDEAFNTEPDDVIVVVDETDLSDLYSSVGTVVAKCYGESEKARKFYEERWLQDLRQYKGIYDPEVLSKIPPGKSRAFIRATMSKVCTVDARLMDLLFPANEGSNWSIEPTPIPELAQEQLVTVAQGIYAATGELPTPEQTAQVIEVEAARRAKAMTKVIADQLADVKYKDLLRSVVHSGNLYGTGISKGPLVEKKIISRYVEDGMGWSPVEIEIERPYLEFVSIWDIYPDMDACSEEEMRYCVQRHIMKKYDLYNLSRRSDFFGEAIRRYIKANPGGNVTRKDFETELSLLNPAEGSDKTGAFDNRYEVIEYWGYVEAEDLMNCGCPGADLGDDYDGPPEVPVNIWCIDNVVIKVQPNPLYSTKCHPFHFYYFKKDESSIFGDGLATLMRDTQQIRNSAVRAMLDNAAISAGPIAEVNVDLLEPGEDPTDIHAFRVFQRSGSGQEANSPAIRFNYMTPNTNQFMSIAGIAQEYDDEVTAIPRYMSGDTQSMSGPGRTATGLSMLMGAANITIKDMLTNVDDGITKPIITDMYSWNMEFNPDDSIKGDYKVIAHGAASLIAKEIKLQNILQFYQITAQNPIFASSFNPTNFLNVLAELLDIQKEGIIKSPTEIQQEQQMQQAQMEQENLRTAALIMNGDEAALNRTAAQQNVPAEAVVTDAGATVANARMQLMGGGM